MTRKELTQEMRAISEMMGKTKNCTKTEWERTNKKQPPLYRNRKKYIITRRAALCTGRAPTK